MADQIPVAGGQSQQVQNQAQQDIEKAKELVEQAQKMGWKVEDTEQFQGVIKDLKRTREKLHEVGYQANQQQPKQQEKKADPQELMSKLNSIQDGDLVTGDQVKDLISGLVGLVQEGFQSTSQVITADRSLESEEKAKERYSAEKVGKDLEYNNVIENYYPEVVRKLGVPGLHQQIMASKDPSEAAYQLALTHPDLRAKAEESTKSKVAEEITNNLRRVRKTSGAGGLLDDIMAQQQTRDTLLAKSSEQLEAELREEELG